MADKPEANRGPSHGAWARDFEQSMMKFADDVGTFLGHAEKNATDWLNEQKPLRDQLTAVRDRINELRGQLFGRGNESGKG